ncbi:HDOD domain-containing protein [Thiocystis violacea]|uniref:HDOD domain-containing protein n=1 Tax=Thiocystis violacea TaxID=13725 RepID=UPI0019048834|nr:HDOD domain-containing protein [Thiocystis violacea]MBK1721564.1 hypothetical protein [Thiocystis violacea]
MSASKAIPPKSASLHLYPSKDAINAASAVIRDAKIPHIPEVVLALRQEMARPEPDLQVAANLIVQDVAITGDLLKAINSPLFNLGARITSVSQAAALMGVKRLTSYVTGVAINRLVEGMDVRVHGVWKDIMTQVQAIVASAQVSACISPEEAYVFGIMHDVGSLVFASQSGDYISQWVRFGDAEPSRLLEYERTTMGVEHGAVGFLLAANWKLPEYLALAICHHHAAGDLQTTDPRVNKLIALAKLGYYLVALSRGLPEQPELLEYLDDAVQDLDLRDDQLSDLCARATSGAWN